MIDDILIYLMAIIPTVIIFLLIMKKFLISLKKQNTKFASDIKKGIKYQLYNYDLIQVENSNLREIEKKHTNLINALENKLMLLDKQYQEKCHDKKEIESNYTTLKSYVETIKNNFKGEEHKLKKEVINLQNHLNNEGKKLKTEILNLKKAINTKQNHLENCWKAISKYEMKEKLKNTSNSSVIEPNFNFCNACDRSTEYCICAK